MADSYDTYDMSGGDGYGAHSDTHTDADPQRAFAQYLQDVGTQYQVHIDKLRQQRDAEEAARGYPIISSYAAAKTRTEPIEDRLYTLQKKREERIARETEERRKEEAAETKAAMRAAPKVTPHAHAVRREGSVAEQSERWIAAHKKHLEELHRDALDREMQAVQKGPRVVPHPGAAPERRHGLPVEDYLIEKERARQREMYEKVEQQAQSARATATPKINRTPRGSTNVSTIHADTPNASTAQRGGDVVQRLYTPNFRPAAYDAEFVEHCTFKPETNADDHLHDDPELAKLPPHERILKRHEKLKERHHHECDARSNKPQRHQLELSQGSRIIAARQREKDGRSAQDRLYEEARTRQRHINEARQRIQDERANSPTIMAPKSRDLNASNPMTNGPGPKAFHERQQRFLRVAEEKRKKLAAEVAQERTEVSSKECTFKPQMARARKQSAREGLGQAPEPELRQRRDAQQRQDFYDRNQAWLAKRDKTIEAAKQAEEVEEAQKCLFQPVVHHEVPLPAEPSNATGFESHIARQRAARKERAVAAAGGPGAVARHEKVVALRAKSGNRSTVARAPKLSSGAATPRPGNVASLRKPVSARDVDYDAIGGGTPAPYYRGQLPQQSPMGDDAVDGYYAQVAAQQHRRGSDRRASMDSQQHEYHLQRPEGDHSYVGSAWASQGIAAPVPHQYYASGGWEHQQQQAHSRHMPPPREASVASASSSAAYDTGVAAIRGGSRSGSSQPHQQRYVDPAYGARYPAPDYESPQHQSVASVASPPAYSGAAADQLLRQHQEIMRGIAEQRA